MSFFDEMMKSFLPSQDAFVFMWVILGIGFFAIYLVIDRWLYISARCNVDAARFAQRIRSLLVDKNEDEAIAICESGGKLTLPRVIGNAIKSSRTSPVLVRASIEQDVVGSISGLERRLPFLAMCSNVATLLGLMGTIYGLILSFNAVGQPNVDPTLKTSMLASGISAAMNTTLMGLIIAVPCIFAYSAFRARVDRVTAEIDKYALDVLRFLLPKGMLQKNFQPSSRRRTGEMEGEPNIVPMMSLMTVLIPLLLSSTEFIKLGNISINLPRGSSFAGGDEKKTKKQNLSLGVIVTSEGIDIKSDLEKTMQAFRTGKKDKPAISKKNGKHDYVALNKYLAELKRRALYSVVKHFSPGTRKSASIYRLTDAYLKLNTSGFPLYGDMESVKIVAENKVKYQTVVSVMDAARAVKTSSGRISLFPNVSIAGGLF